MSIERDIEYESFKKDYKEVLDNIFPITVEEVRNLIIKVLKNDQDRNINPELIDLYLFIKKGLENDKPLNWLTGWPVMDSLSEINFKHEMDESEKELKIVKELIDKEKIKYKTRNFFFVSEDDLNDFVHLVLKEAIRIIDNEYKIPKKLEIGDIFNCELDILRSGKYLITHINLTCSDKEKKFWFFNSSLDITIGMR